MMAILQVVLVFLILFFLHSYWVGRDKGENTTVMVSGKSFTVKKGKTQNESAQLLSEIDSRVIKIIARTTRKNQELGNLLNQKYSHKIISQGRSDSETSYTISKKKMVFCLESKKTKQLHEINLMMYVVLHELAHLGTLSVGHGQEFKDNFSILLNVAQELKLYSSVSLSGKEYCGMTI